jgi:hypothetical protein
MKSIAHLSKEEQLHFIRCHCGKYIDMRNLQEVFDHQHWPEPNIKAMWRYSIKTGKPTAYTKDGQQIELN